MFDIIFYNVYALYSLQEKMRAVRMRILCKMFDNMIAVYAMLINLSMISVLLLACELAHIGALARIEARARAATSRDTILLE